MTYREQATAVHLKNSFISCYIIMCYQRMSWGETHCIWGPASWSKYRMQNFAQVKIQGIILSEHHWGHHKGIAYGRKKENILKCTSIQIPGIQYHHRGQATKTTVKIAQSVV